MNKTPGNYSFTRQKSLVFLLVSWILFSFQLSGFSQEDSVQVLRILIKSEISQHEKAKHLIQLSGLLSYKNPEEGIVCGKEGAQLALDLADGDLYVSGLIAIGLNYLNRHQFDSATRYLHKARAADAKPYYSNQNIRINNLLGTIHRRQNSWDSAMIYWQHALRLATELGNPDYLAGVYGNLGTYASDRGDHENASNYYYEALRYYEQSDNQQNLAILLNNIGQINHGIGDLERAIEYTTRAVQINERIQSFSNLSMNYGNLGIMYREKQMPEEAEQYFVKALEIAVQNGFVLEEARALLNLGSLFLEQRKFDAALNSFEKSLSLCLKNGISYGVVKNYMSIADYYQLTEQWSIADEYLDKAFEIAEKLELTDIKQEVFEKKSQVYEKQQDYMRALHFYKQYVKLTDSLEALSNKNYVEELQTRYETQKKEFENQHLKADNENKIRIIKNQRTIVTATIIILILVIILALTIFRNRQKIRKTNAELNELNTKILIQNKQLEELNITKDKLFSVVAHDLKSPFNSLLGFLQMLMEDFDSFSNKEKREMVELVYFQSNNTYSLLENLLQWAMAQRGQINFQPAIRDIAILVYSELEFLSNRAHKKNITIDNRIQAETTAWVDSNLFKIIIRNIVNNSIKFTPRMGSIIIEATADNETVLIRISDNGIGMSDDIVSGLFELRNLKTSKGTENELGSGLGLLLVKEFIDLHKAQIQVESTPGNGTVFSMIFHQKQPLIS